MVTEEEVLGALRRVHSIRAGSNIVDLGLIEEVKIEGEVVNVKMRGILSSCPYNFVLAVRGEREIKKIEGVKDANVEVLIRGFSD
jgi:metal-sulfur cluster biosynthetic enzyme